MQLLLLILVPLITGLLLFSVKQDKTVKWIALAASVVALGLSLTLAFSTSALEYHANWLPQLGSSFSLLADGMASMLCLLTAVSYIIVFAAIWKHSYKNSNAFYALMMLTQAGLLGVFLADDGLLFYFFWELALIPVYFLCSKWGNERRIPVTFKFFVYTFAGSLLMLVGLLFLYYHTPDQSFAWASLRRAMLSEGQQHFFFWMFFVAFAIKMPIFPFHTWQPDTYEQSPTGVTMILSAVMVKMGLFATLRWLLPLFPEAAKHFDNVVIGLSVVGMVYASCIALVQDDIKRLVAYSSIAHIGLMSAAIFSVNQSSLQGVMLQMFSHGINILGMWVVVELIERQFNTRKISELGGIAQKAPGLATLLMIVALANVALPLTNAFVGEFLMFNGLYHFNVWYMAVAGLSIILGAVYTLNMIQKVFYGNTNSLTENAKDIFWNEKLILGIVVVFILWIGIYPQQMFDMTSDSVHGILRMLSVK